MFFRATALKVRKAFRKKAYLVSTSFFFFFKQSFDTFQENKTEQQQCISKYSQSV